MTEDTGKHQSSLLIQAKDDKVANVTTSSGRHFLPVSVKSQLNFNSDCSNGFICVRWEEIRQSTCRFAHLLRLFASVGGVNLNS